MDPPSSPPVVAHRGCAAEYPENTVAAIEAVAPLVDRIELDVRRCGTGELVVFHDPTLDRVTDASGRVDRTPLDRLAALEVAGSGEPIPTLAAAFEATPADVGLMLDLKASGLVADVLALHADHDHELLLTADNRAPLATARRADPTVRTSYAVRESPVNRLLRPFVPGLPPAVYAPEDVDALVRAATSAGCAVLSPRYELCLQTDLVAVAHDAGLRVFPWTVTTEREFAALAEAGVDGVVSDVCRLG
ncbi:glycerophosphodiester phosphodiesterase [Halorubrum sp. CBA1125]|uniref:glycerophosphodiester phosphodiesterase n=1 Tax=Halorubrum sp. CBA1125 TaxID=2668072 RepID=UPI002AA29BE0|nr:glycerophosphodiester phosphodiesterase [Halorubrum sp. CBA1125]